MMSESLAEILRDLEERLAMPAADESRASLAALLAAECREFGSSGRIYDAEAILETLIAGARPARKFEDFSVRPVGADAALVTYLSRSISGPGWKPPALRSSVWIRGERGWQLLFHQGTRLTESES